MSETQKKAYLVTAAMAILHNGKRYEQGDKIELTDEEAERIALYVQLVEPEQVQSESAVTEADIQEAEANISQAEAKTKGKKGE
ncbi:Uncharacterised protein [Actinobacillus ureae]|uniref:DUF7210 domain-containing protein n=1 Tax=Actinobacillus ureae ATCC 25976 TaxID=887324 RepID=E8KKT3_9PAST|nr:hypothetical protein [Actinobacillus ureae]EFX90492.1 hypothetical protein HMPREF0027_2450 [Actinobacillus ureae ATCC 25976]SUT86159.1 Uncharacterised protein [Actinobacillus ureae]SUU44937.1 Uncharacterised protein [Actinobacillus ureae]